MAKVLQVYKTDFPGVGGGVDAVVCNLLHASDTQWQQSLLRIVGHDCKPVAREIEGIAVHALHLPGPPTGHATLRQWLSFLITAVPASWRLLRLLRKASIDLVHLHTLQHYHVYFVLAALLGGPPYVLTLHGSEVEVYGARDRVTQTLWRWTLRHATAVSAVSDTLAGIARQRLPRGTPLVTIRNGVAATALPAGDELRARLGIARPFCVMVGALIDAKGHDVALRAWPQLPASRDHFDLVLIGAGERMAAYQATVETAGLAGRVHFVGHLPHADTLTLMRDSALLILPSRREGFGLVAIEAGALGVPVLASDLPVFRELLGALSSECLVAVDDAEALAVAIAHLLDDDTARPRLGQAWRARVATEFSLAACLARYQDWYRAALTPRDPLPQEQGT